MHTQLTIGSDPEYMVEKDGKIVSAIPIFDYHDKYDRIEFGDGIQGYYDNVNGEFSMNPGASTDETIQQFRNLVKNVGEFLKVKGAKLLAQSSYTFPEEELDHKDAKSAGCSAEFCAHEIDMVEPPVLRQTNFRCAGGHIHIGRIDWREPASEFLLDDYSKIAAVRAMDFYVGTTLTFLENDPTAPARKELYGKAGRHRPTMYGVEYRSLSNYWTSHPKLVSFVDRLTRYAIAQCEDNTKYWQNFNVKEIANIINTGDVELARQFIETNLPKAFYQEALELKTLPYNPDIAENYAQS